MNDIVGRSGRNDLVDVAKGIGMIFVIAGHNPLLMHQASVLMPFIYSFHMPLFFLLSGIYFKVNSDFKDFLRVKSDALLKPYIIVVALTSLAYCVSGNDLINLLMGDIYSTTYTIDSHAIPLWFLPTLFVTMVASWCIMRIKKVTKISDFHLGIFCFFMLVAGAIFIRVFFPYDIPFGAVGGTMKTWVSHGLPWGIDIIPLTSAYFLLGYLLKDKILKITWDARKFIVAAMILFVMWQISTATMDLAIRRYQGIFMVTLKTFVTIYCAILISKKVTEWKIINAALAFLGENSLTIFLFHSLIETTILQYFKDSGMRWGRAGALALILTVILSALLSLIITHSRLLSYLLTPHKKAGGIQTPVGAATGIGS